MRRDALLCASPCAPPAGRQLYIFLEYVPGGSINSLLKRFGCLPENTVIAYTAQLLQGLVSWEQTRGGHFARVPVIAPSATHGIAQECRKLIIRAGREEATMGAEQRTQLAMKRAGTQPF